VICSQIPRGREKPYVLGRGKTEEVVLGDRDETSGLKTLKQKERKKTAAWADQSLQHDRYNDIERFGGGGENI